MDKEPQENSNWTGPETVRNFINNPQSLLKNEISLDFEEVLRLLNQSKTILESRKFVNLVLVIGCTGDGKSTLINCLQNKILEKTIYDDFQKVIDLDKNVPNNVNNSAKIVHDPNSGTLLPEVFPFNGFNYCDSPGFLDTRCAEEKLCASFAFKKILNICENVKGVIITIDYNTLIDAKFHKLRMLIEKLSELFKVEQDLFNNCIWVFTKTEESKETVIKALKYFERHEQMYLKNHPDDAKRKMYIKYAQLITEDTKRIVIGKVLKKKVLENKELENIVKKKIEGILTGFELISRNCFNSDFNENNNEINERLIKFVEKSNLIFDYLKTKLEEKRRLYREIRKETERFQNNIQKIEFYKSNALKKEELNEDMKNSYYQKKEKYTKILNGLQGKARNYEKKLSVIFHKSQEYESNNDIKTYGRVFRNVGFFLLQNSSDTYMGPEPYRIVCKEHKEMKREVVNLKEYIQVIQISERKHKIKLIKPATVTVQIFVLKKNMPDAIVAIEENKKKNILIENKLLNIKKKIGEVIQKLENLEIKYNKISNNYKGDICDIEMKRKFLEDNLNIKIAEIQKKTKTLNLLKDEISRENLSLKIYASKEIFQKVISISKMFNFTSDFLSNFSNNYNTFLENKIREEVEEDISEEYDNSDEEISLDRTPDNLSKTANLEESLLNI